MSRMMSETRALAFTAVAIFAGSALYYFRPRDGGRNDDAAAAADERGVPPPRDDRPAARAHGGSIVGEVLAAHGITHVFALCGGHISPILQGARDRGLRIVDMRDERSAAFAADAASRMTGKPGVVAVTAGPGVTNTVTAVKNAQMAQQPIIVIGGATATMLRGRGALQDIDQMALMAPVTKWYARANRVRDIRPILEKALRVSVEGVPGPVFVELAVDLLYPEVIVHDWYMTQSGIKKMKGVLGRIARRVLEAYLWCQFHMPHLGFAFTGTSTVLAKLGTVGRGTWRRGPLLHHRRFQYSNGAAGVPDGRRQAKRVARALARANRPVLAIGNQAMVNLDPDNASALAEAVVRLGVPTFLGGSARGLLGRGTGIQFRHSRSNALKEADFVLVAGFPFDFRLGYGLKINKKATLVAVNLDSVALKKNRRPTHAIRAHPGRFLQRLAESAVDRLPDWSVWFGTLRDRETARDSEIAAKASTQGPLVDSVHLFQRIETKLSDDSILIVDGGDFVATGSYILQPRKPLSWLDPGVFGTLGVGGGFAVGAAASRPNAEVWLFYGDGSSAYSLSEFDTFRRLGFAPIVVIGTDASWQQIAREQIKLLGTDLGTVLRRSDYHMVAEGYGGKGLLLTDPSKVDEVLDEALKLSAKGHGVCVNVHLADSDFREGSISV